MQNSRCVEQKMPDGSSVTVGWISVSCRTEGDWYCDILQGRSNVLLADHMSSYDEATTFMMDFIKNKKSAQ